MALNKTLTSLLLTLALSLPASPGLAKYKKCKQLPAAQQADCKAKVAAKCAALKAYWDRVYCEDKIAKSQDPCHAPPLVTECKALKAATDQCRKARSMRGHAGAPDPAWLKAAVAYPALLKRVRTFKPKFTPCNRLRIPDCKLTVNDFRDCEQAGKFFKGNFAQYYAWAKMQHLRVHPLRRIKSYMVARFLLAELQPVVELNKDPTLHVADNTIETYLAAVQKKYDKLYAAWKAKDARQWRKAGRFKKMHKKGFANCVFSDKPLGVKDAASDKLVTKFTRGDRIFARCYAGKDFGKAKPGLSLTLIDSSGPSMDRTPTPLRGKRPKVVAFELTEVFAPHFKLMRKGVHDMSIHYWGTTGKVISRSKTLHFTRIGAYTTTNLTVGMVSLARGRFTLMVP